MDRQHPFTSELPEQGTTEKQLGLDRTEPSQHSNPAFSFKPISRIASIILISLWVLPLLASIAVIYLTLAPRESPLRTLQGHTQWVDTLAFSPDGKILASGSEDGTIKFWRVSDGQLLQTINLDFRDVTSVAFSKDGKTLASSTDTMTVNLWSVPDGRLIHTLQNVEIPQNGVISLTDPVCGVTFSPDGKLLAAGSQNDLVIVWRLSDDMPVQSFQAIDGCDNNGPSFAFSPDSATLVTYVGRGEVDFWRVADGGLIGKVPDDVNALTFSPDGTMLATGSYFEDKIRIWHVGDGRLLRTFSASGDKVDDLAFTSNGMVLAANSDDGTLNLWRVSDGRILRNIRAVYGNWWDTLNNESGTSISSFAFSPDGKMLATGVIGGKILLWSTSY